MHSFCEIANFLQNDLGFSRAETEDICNKSGLLSLAVRTPMIDITVFDDALIKRFKDYDGLSMGHFLDKMFNAEQVNKLKAYMGVTS